MKKCHKCGHEWVSVKQQPGVKDFCEKCSAYLHCCLNCRYYEPSVHNQCHIGTTEWVGDKQGCNFCDEFEFADSARAAEDSSKRDNARSALEGLFGGSDAPSDDDRLDFLKKL